MHKILQITEFKGLLTIEIECLMKKNKIGDIIKDDKNNVFKIMSVALMSGAGVNRRNTNLVLEPLNKVVAYGNMLDVE